MTTPPLTLISFDLCPFVQRSVITLKHKNLPFEITYIDLKNKPDWFLKISPFGKVPVLKVGENDVLFESAVINEYIDDVTPSRLQHDDPLKRAYEKAWIEFGSGLILNQYALITKTKKEDYNDKLEIYLKNLKRLEDQVSEGGLFRGSQFSLVDAAYAPLFQRHFLIPAIDQNTFWQDLPKTKAWAKNLTALPEVQTSVMPEFKELFKEYCKKMNSYAFSIKV